MNHVIGYELLAGALATYRNLSFAQLQTLVGEGSSHRKLAADGVDYDVSVRVRWCSVESADIRVIGTVNEAAWGGPHDSVDDTFVVTCTAAHRA